MLPFLSMNYSMNIRDIAAKLNGEGFHLNALLSKFSNFNNSSLSKFGIVNLRALEVSLFGLSIFNIVQSNAKKEMFRIDALWIVASMTNKLISWINTCRKKVRNPTGFKITRFIFLKKIGTSSVSAYIKGSSPDPAATRLVYFVPKILDVFLCKIRHWFNRFLHTYLDAQTLMGVAK